MRPEAEECRDDRQFSGRITRADIDLVDKFGLNLVHDALHIHAFLQEGGFRASEAARLRSQSGRLVLRL